MTTAQAIIAPVAVLAGQLAFKGEALGTGTRIAYYVTIVVLVAISAWSGAPRGGKR